MKSKLLEYSLSSQVQRVLKAESITLPELAEMLEQSAITSHDRGNRRFNIWLFDVRKGKVHTMTLLEPPNEPAHTDADFVAYEECEACAGETCRACGYTGEMKTVYKPKNPRKRSLTTA